MLTFPSLWLVNWQLRLANEAVPILPLSFFPVSSRGCSRDQGTQLARAAADIIMQRRVESSKARK